MEIENIIEYYPSGKLQHNFYFINGLHHGMDQYFWQDGTMYNVSQHKRGQMNGYLIIFNYTK